MEELDPKYYIHTGFWNLVASGLGTWTPKVCNILTEDPVNRATTAIVVHTFSVQVGTLGFETISSMKFGTEFLFSSSSTAQMAYENLLLMI